MNLSDAKKVCRKIQKQVWILEFGENYAPNEFDERHPSEISLDEGILIKSDICYGRSYPNSYLDIWYPPAETPVKNGIFIYMHGGGFLFGDKQSGDPLAKTKGIAGILRKVCEEGYITVSLNYCFAPEYTFPSQLYQLNEALSFLTDNQDQYSLNMDRIILGGSSAGADMTGIYCAALYNPEYAGRIGLKPVIVKEQVLCAAIDEAATGIGGINNSIDAMLQVWTNEEDPVAGVNNELMDYPRFIRDEYVPSYIIASNQEEVFPIHAENLCRVLSAASSEYRYYYVASETDDLEHGFMTRYETNIHARECLEGMLDFMNHYLI